MKAERGGVVSWSMMVWVVWYVVGGLVLQDQSGERCRAVHGMQLCFNISRWRGHAPNWR